MHLKFYCGWALLAALAVALAPASATAQLVTQQAPAVGGVSINPEGVLSAPEVADNDQLRATWQAGLAAAPADLEPYNDLRFVSLKGLEQRVAEASEQGNDIPDDVRYLAGLLRVKHVLVYPKQGDIVLAGPAEGWKADRLGNVVGATTNRPVLTLDDLMVALRTMEDTNGQGMSCSIDPTQEGLKRVQRLQNRLTSDISPKKAAGAVERALGEQTVSVSGVPATSRFARTMVAADFRMKRLAMGLEEAPIGGLPSYLTLLEGRGAQESMLPRWWMAANYEPMLRDEEGLAWEIRGQGVKCMTENDFVSADGERSRSGKSGTVAQQWADRFTEGFEELADHDSSFGRLRNAMDMAVATALVAKEDLLTLVGLSLPNLMGDAETEQYPAPKSVATEASFMRMGSRWVITASGGVQFYPWLVADQAETSADVAAVRSAGAEQLGGNWWWQ
ncbi:hypothetical protein Mal64_03750 [Pseudobythopirellula maris]|uniref:DUF1598 domain-containing protein n=1 Tax=Pseudobythopirellula maris TaxID=2527991 RepID=A0A5C5ZUT4_9BACT|nr:DUF1598 domain-containing protein [Pseudobythopirellula maris]TWT89993.1 hypothetical protein Mal64_03750 [Pseudobythopirellula maris]